MKKGFQTKLALLSLVSVISISTVMAAPNYANGDAQVTTNGTETLIQHAQGKQIFNNNWNNFDLKKGESANFQFNGQNQVSINRVIGGEMSTIYGQIKSSGAGANTSHIILSNPNGLLFGAGSLVNTNAFTATTAKTINASVNTNGDISVQLKDMGKGQVTLNGSTWAINKSAAVVAQDINVKDSYLLTKTGTNAIDYKGSALSTEDLKNFNSITSDGEVVLSNVKLISNDGVTFELKKEHGGAIYNNVNPANVASSKKHTINVENSQIASGSVQMYAGGTKDSNITIKNSAVKGVKLVNFAYGDIALVSKGKVNIQDSSVETLGSYQVIDGKIARNTFENKAHNVDGQSIDISKDGGAISISGDEGVEISNSKLNTVASNYEDKTIGDSQRGGIQVVSLNGDINVKNNTNISSRGSVYMSAKGNVNIEKSSVNAIGKQEKIEGVTEGFENAKFLYIDGANVNVKNSQLKANGTATIYANKGDINIANDITNGIEAKTIYMASGNDINTNNTVLKANTTTMYADKNINLDKTSVQSYTQGTIAKAYMTSANGSVKTAKDSFVKTNGNKLVVRATKGDINLNLRAAANEKAGIEAYAGNNTTLNAQDGTLSIARIETDTLNLNADNKFLADNNSKTAVDGRAYIQVRKDGGFNMDSKPEYVGKNVENINYESYRNEIKDENGNTIAYSRHSMTLKDDAKFTLDYKKGVEPEAAPDPSRITYSYDDLTKLPLQAANPTLPSNISNNMTDPTSGVIAAAAAIEIDEDEQLDY